MKLKFFLAAFGIICGASMLSAQHTLTVTVSNVQPGKGTVDAGLYNKEAGFLKKGAQWMQKRVKATGGTVKIIFENVPDGVYGLALYQDQNANGKCDTNMLGIPTEGFGFSNNVHPRLSAPSFSQAKYSLQGDKAIAVALIR